ncbi:hypothetical protein U1Q18_052582 [Sarracenia purpurea var. burkii]
MKGYLKYLISEMPDDSVMRAHSIVVMSKKYSRENVDVWHCAPSRPVPILIRIISMDLLDRRRDLLIGGFGESGSVIDERRPHISLSEVDVLRGGEQQAVIDPGPSVSEVGVSRNEVERRGSIIMDPDEFSNVLRNVITSVRKSEERKELIVDDKGNAVFK